MDPAVMKKTGRVFNSHELAVEYGIADVDGRVPDIWRYFREHMPQFSRRKLDPASKKIEQQRLNDLKRRDEERRQAAERERREAQAERQRQAAAGHTNVRASESGTAGQLSTRGSRGSASSAAAGAIHLHFNGPVVGEGGMDELVRKIERPMAEALARMAARSR